MFLTQPWNKSPQQSVNKVRQTKRQDRQRQIKPVSDLLWFGYIFTEFRSKSGEQIAVISSSKEAALPQSTRGTGPMRGRSTLLAV